MGTKSDVRLWKLLGVGVGGFVWCGVVWCGLCTWEGGVGSIAVLDASWVGGGGGLGSVLGEVLGESEQLVVEVDAEHGRHLREAETDGGHVEGPRVLVLLHDVLLLLAVATPQLVVGPVYVAHEAHHVQKTCQPNTVPTNSLKHYITSSPYSTYSLHH